VAYFKVSNPNNKGVVQAITACQMALGIIVKWIDNAIEIVTFEGGDKELVLDTIGEFGCMFITDLPMI